ncbi:MAG: hypothetical protein O7G87_22455, partial [bacterium]|nr:hypothetical protein [bacterium]
AFSHYGKTAYEIRIIDGKGLWERADSDAFRAPSQNPIASNLSDIPGARPYKGEYGTTSIIPRIGIETGKLKLGAAAISEDVLGKQSLFLSALTSHDFDLNLFALYEYRTRRPTFFLEAYRLRRSVEEDVLNRDLDFRLFNQVFTLIGLEFGAKYKMRRGGLIDGRLIYSRSGTTQQVARFNGLGRTTIGATPFNGLDLAFTYHLDALARSRDSEINPRQGRQFTFRYDRYFNWFFSGFEENTALLIEKYDRYFYNQLTLDWNEFIPLPGRRALGVRFFGGVIDKAVDDTFDFFIGGLPGMKGYSFYSLEGSRALMLRTSYRFPLLGRINQQSGPIYSDQLYGAFFAGIGRAWDGSAQDDVLKRGWKREIGAQLRYDASSFYLFPTRISLDAAYGFDTIPLQDPRDPIQKSGFKMYFTLLFGFLQSVGGR